MGPDYALRRIRLDGDALGIEGQPIALDDVAEPIDVAAGRSLFRVEDLLRLVDLIASVGAEA